MNKHKRVENDLVVENARIGFRNFEGKEAKFNKAGERNFCVFFDYEDGVKIEKMGWNIKWLDPKEEDDEPTPFLKVAVSYKNIPPKVLLISGNGKTLLDEGTIKMLDWSEIETVDLVIRPYNWEVQDKSGVKAYVKTMYVTIVEDEFASKYYDVPLSTDSDSEESPFED